MINFNQKNSQTNLIVLGIATASLMFVEGAIASKASSQIEQTSIAQASVLQAESAQQETLYLNNDRTYSYNLVAKEQGVIGGVTVPAGATIVGKYVPAEGGLQYVAEAVTYDDNSYTINASSEIIEDQKDPRDTSAGAIAGDAGIGAAGGAVLGEVLGDAGATEIIGGAAAGAAAGNLTAERVVVIEPDVEITLYE